MSGILTSDASSFHWVYDCGSNQTSALKREIDCIKTRGHVDFLFLSHLDSDHVNGIDRLLSEGTVTEIVLPYLNDIDRLVAAAHDITTGAITGSFLTFLTDIEGWFAARGVERISYIMPNNDDDGSEEDRFGDGPDLPKDGKEDLREGKIKAKWSRKAINPPLDSDPHREEPTGPSTQRMEMGTSLQMIDDRGPLDWLLAPYAHRPSDQALAAFEAALKSKFHGKHNNPDFLADVLRHPNNRKVFRDCYDHIWSDHNLVSMALYAGPIHTRKWHGNCELNSHQLWRYRHTNAIGWLSTGDMHLNIGRRRSAFLKYYGKLLDKVNVFVLPHHGAHRNFESSLLSKLPNATQCIAAAGTNNSYGHPDEGVIRAVIANGKHFAWVNDEIHSALQCKYCT